MTGYTRPHSRLSYLLSSLMHEITHQDEQRAEKSHDIPVVMRETLLSAWAKST